MTQHERVDDDDGHYIVTPETYLGERCTSISSQADEQ